MRRPATGRSAGGAYEAGAAYIRKQPAVPVAAAVVGENEFRDPNTSRALPLGLAPHRRRRRRRVRLVDVVASCSFTSAE